MLPFSVTSAMGAVSQSAKLFQPLLTSVASSTSALTPSPTRALGTREAANQTQVGRPYECLLVKGSKPGASWSFPRGKKNKNKDEEDHNYAVREVWEETGFDIIGQQQVRTLDYSQDLCMSLAINIVFV